jgi:hypothetical protein
MLTGVRHTRGAAPSSRRQHATRTGRVAACATCNCSLGIGRLKPRSGISTATRTDSAGWSHCCTAKPQPGKSRTRMRVPPGAWRAAHNQRRIIGGVMTHDPRSAGSSSALAVSAAWARARLRFQHRHDKAAVSETAFDRPTEVSGPAGHNGTGTRPRHHAAALSVYVPLRESTHLRPPGVAAPRTPPTTTRRTHARPAPVTRARHPARPVPSRPR